MAEQKNQLAAIDRFTNVVMACYGEEDSNSAISKQERDCIKSYFQGIDLALRNSKEGYTWKQVRMDELAPRLKHYAHLGINMNIDNHLFAIPYKDGDSGMIKMNLLLGYKGRQYQARKFAINPPKNFIVHLVCKNDSFQAIYKDANHANDNFVFVENTFDRGEILGAFCYVEYEDSSLNKLTVMTLSEILAHKPPRASDKFWGGPFKSKMFLKTVVIEACKQIDMDAEKMRLYQADIDQIRADELNAASVEANAVAEEKTATGDFIDVDFSDVDEETGEVKLEV